MTLERGGGVALWRQIQRIIEAEIAAPATVPGERLPTEAALSARFGVNRHTVRRALQALESRGLIRVEQGRGAFVSEDVVSYDLSRRVRFSENLLAQHRIPGGEVLDCEVGPVQGRVARALRLLPGELVERLEILSRADGQGLLVCSLCFPHARFPGIGAIYRETGSVTASLARLGVRDYVRRETRITARLPVARDARLLGQSRRKPVLVVESISVDDQGQPVEYGLTRWASDRVEFVVRP
jgi:GntR family phosphonate transport system transcriptional regulator